MVRTKVFVGNLSFQIKESELATEFGVAGKVISANIITRGPRSLGYGFVELDSVEDANNAVKVMNKKEINGRPINVEIAKPQNENRERQPRSEGRPRRSTNNPTRRNFRPRRPEGEAQNEDRDEGKKEEGENRRKGDFRRRNRRRNFRSYPQRRRVSNEDREESKTTLFVANLPFNLDDSEFEKIVTEHNLKLKSAHVVKKRNGRSKGYGFIEFDTHDDQQKALPLLNKKVVDSRELSVKVALTEIKREGRETEEQNESKPVEKKTTPPAVSNEKKTTPPPAVSNEKKSAPPPAASNEKKAPTTEKKEKTSPPEKSSSPSEKKVEKAPEKKPQETKTSEKSPQSEKKTPDKKTEEKK